MTLQGTTYFFSRVIQSVSAPYYYLLGCVIMVCITSCTKEETGLEARATTFNGSIGTQDLLLYQGNDYVQGSLSYAGISEGVLLSSSTTLFGWGSPAQSTPEFTVNTLFTPNENYTIVLFDSALRRRAYIAITRLSAADLNDRPAVRFFNCVISPNAMAVVNDTNRLLTPSVLLGRFPEPIDTDPFTPSVVYSGKVKLVNTTTGAALDSIAGVALEANKYYSFYASGVVGATGVNKPRLHLQIH